MSCSALWNMDMVHSNMFSIFLNILRSLDRTSLSHSLLWVCAHPLVIVIGQYAMHYLFKIKNSKPSLGESIGSLVGFFGLALTVIDIRDDSEVTILGDLAAFMGACAYIGYLLSGRILRFIELLCINMLNVIQRMDGPVYVCISSDCNRSTVVDSSCLF